MIPITDLEVNGFGENAPPGNTQEPRLSLIDPVLPRSSASFHVRPLPFPHIG
jgi:hypothetical protein